MSHVITGFTTSFKYHKDLAERAMAQVSDDHLHHPLHQETNSIAVVVKHVAGNLLSRWTDFLTTDGEKPWRDRDEEFRDTFETRTEMLAEWDRGWNALLETLAQLSDADLKKSVTIRGETLPVPTALARSLAHTAYHVGQIVQIARILAGSDWKTLTIPRGGSKAHNEKMWGHDQYNRGNSAQAAGHAL
ncbi:MAG TPA: DinB family protein [Phycisphaerales bacterium]|nr:DinB family protein [Phycisphaerales bacterium]